MSEMARLARARPGDFLWWTARLEQHVLKRTAGVFCNSAFTESFVGPRAIRTWRVPNPVRADFFSSPRSVARAWPPVLLNVATIGANKRQRQLLELARRLHQQGHRFSLAFVGHADPQDPGTANFLQQVRAAAQDGYARFEGLLLDQNLIAAYDQASA